jgi:hypothetical protein
MLMTTNLDVVFTALVVAACVIILIRILLLAGRFVRAVEKIAAKTDKQA